MAVKPQRQTFRTQWLSQPASVPSPVNQFMLQGEGPSNASNQPEGFVLTLGYVGMPVSPGAANPSGVPQSDVVAPIVPVGRFYFTPSRLKELSKLIAQILEEPQLGESD